MPAPAQLVGLVTAYAGGGREAMHQRICFAAPGRCERPRCALRAGKRGAARGRAPGRAHVRGPRTCLTRNSGPTIGQPVAGAHGARLPIDRRGGAPGDRRCGGSSATVDRANGIARSVNCGGHAPLRCDELQAQVAALRGDADGALRALQRAADQGWRDVWLAEREPYFAILRPRADFRALLERVRADNEANIRTLAPEAVATPTPKS